MTDLENIYKEHFRDVYSFVLSLSGNESIAEEITQDTFFKALKSINSFKGNCKINVWLCQIAKNTYYTYLKKIKTTNLDYNNEIISGLNIEEMLIDKESALIIHKAIHSLDEPYKEIFSLRIFGELSFSQISEIFNKTESWSRVTFHRAKKRINELLEEDIQ